MKKISAQERLLRRVQPINWGRAFLTGVFGVTLMMAFVDIFAMMGVSPFSFEVYLGTLLRGSGTADPHLSWIVGLLGNWLIGGLFGLVYAYFFEYIFRRADARIGLLVGLGHAGLAAVAIFPFFNILHQEVGTGLFDSFGILGSGLSLSVPPILILGHCLFGATAGLLYGPVRLGRVQTRDFEPGESEVSDRRRLIRAVEDPVDRTG
jgi:hypothetical protein